MFFNWRPYVQPFLILIATLIVLPGKISFIDYRQASDELVIQLNKMSPAYAAFEDSQMELDLDAEVSAGQEVKIQAGHKFVFPKPEPVVPEQTVRNLSGITIAEEEVSAGNNNWMRDPWMYNSGGDLKSKSERKEILARQYNNYDLQGASVQQKAKVLVDQELEARKSIDQDTRVIMANGKGTQKNPIYLSRPTKRAKQKSKEPKRDEYNDEPINPYDETPESPDKLVQERSVAKNEPSVSFIEINDYNKFIVKGNVEMTDGLAFLGEGQQIAVYHMHDGEILAEYEVRFPSSNFEIVVDGLEGYLVAELATVAGEILGLGEFDLYSLADIHPSQLEIDEVNIPMSPFVPGLNVNLLSARSFGTKDKQITDAKVVVEGLEREIVANEKGKYQDKSFHPSSSYIIRAEKKNYWGSLAVNTIGQENDLRLFPNTMVDALLGITLGEQAEEAARNAVIWGRVFLDGKLVQGAQVELAGEADFAPVYFSSYIPDQKLNGTTANGMYAFVNVMPGIHSLRVYYNGRYYPAQVVPADAKHVSYVEFKLSSRRAVNVHVYDGTRKSYSLAAVMQILGTEEEIGIREDGREDIAFPGGDGLMFVEIDAGEEFEVARISVDRNAQSMQMPQVPASWLKRMLVDKKLSREVNTGIVVGFGSAAAFEVFLENGHEFDRNNIIYFDKNGVMTREPAGEEGGGFILTNVPVGFRTVAIIPVHGANLSTHPVIVEEGVVSVIPEILK